MSPADKRWLAFISFLFISLFFFVLTCIPTYLYILLFFVGSCAVCYYKAEELQLLDWSGLNPRCGLKALPALRSWLAARTGRVVPAAGRNKNNNRTFKSNARSFVASPADRHFTSFAYRRDAAFNESAFSPRDILMGSYLGKAESPAGAVRPAGTSGTHRDQLRERLSRPNHGAPTPSRRLSFGEQFGAAGRVTITPQRHYPLQQTGTSSVGVFPPAQWDGFRKKNVLTQRNTPVHSPVTVKIARPDNTTRLSFLEQLNSPGALRSPGFEAQADPCSRETVLSVLRASRKRDVDDEDRGHEAEQKSKRRRNDSGGSSHSAFEPLLANGAPAQLVPKPGSLKRGINASVVEESSSLKRSRTSSISSVGGSPVACGVPGSVRNPIRSSYSSSLGYPQRKVASSLAMSPLVSPGSSRCQTPDRAAKKPREENASPAVSSLKCDKETTDTGPGVERSSTPEVPVTPRSDSGGSSGKRKRKIQLVSVNRGDQISLPPPPELGYTITVKDLDMEKKAALSQIQKVLKEPEPEKPSSTSAPNPTPAPCLDIFSKLASSSLPSSAPALSSPSLASLATSSAGPPSTSGAASTAASAPTIDLTVTPSSMSGPALVPTAMLPTLVTSITTVTAAPKLTNPLLESLKDMKRISALSSPPTTAAATSTAPETSVAAPPASVTSVSLSIGAVKSEPALSSAPSAFAPVLSKPLSSTPSALAFGGGGVLGPASTAPASSAPAPSAASTLTLGGTAGLKPAESGFKPIFGAGSPALVSTAEVKPTQPTFKPMFDGAFGQPATSTSASASASLFGGITNAQAASSVPSTTSGTPNPTPSLFGTMNNSHMASLVPSSTSNTQNSTQSLFGALANTKPVAPSVPSSTSSTPNFTPSLFGGLTNSQPVLSSTTSTQNPTQSLFGGPKPTQSTPASIPSSNPNSQNTTESLFGAWSAPNSTFQFGASAATTASASSGITTSATTTSNTNTSFQFGALKPAQSAPSAAPQSAFTFGQNAPATQFTGIGLANNSTPSSTAPTTQAAFGTSAFSAPKPFGNAQPSTPAKTFGFNAGAGGSAPSFGAPASTAAPTFANSTQPTFGGPSSGFNFGNTSAPTMNAPSGSAFAFGAAPATPQNSAASGGFNFSASLPGTQFVTPAAQQPQAGFSFGAAGTDNNSTFGTSTPAFGGAGGPVMFGSPSTPQGFGAPALATPSASFSIGAGSKTGSARQRLQARRQHTRKK
ncbi:nuclear envelope pore membrane protein POM 121 isoform X2 [Trichomycterus rosablanca]|uniref:nuclear envelope pore membrane protein POM 121 isoform X2 n=2 Tax=Trichomycterus rosablanca TaxID=2290929 RepID=UPI002F352B2B